MTQKQELIEKWNELNEKSLVMLDIYSDFSAYLKVKIYMDIVEETLYTKYDYEIKEGME